MQYQRQHQQGRKAHLPRAGRTVLRPNSHRHLARRAVVLLRGRGKGSGMATRAPVAIPIRSTGRVLGRRRTSTPSRYVHLDGASKSRAAERVAAAIERKLRITERTPIGRMVPDHLDSTSTTGEVLER